MTQARALARRLHGMPGPARRLGLTAAALVLALAACAPATAPSAPPSTPGPTPAGPPATLPPPATGTAEPASIAVPTGSPDATGSTGGTVRDDTLLAILPPDIDGVPVGPEEQAFGEATADAAFTANVERAAFFVVARDTDLASGLVAVFRQGRWSDAAYQDWRETYNDGVCAQAGGVKTTAETTIDGRTVWVTVCAQGIRVYHVYLEERRALVSVFSLGEGLFGERIVKDLRVGT